MYSLLYFTLEYWTSVCTKRNATLLCEQLIDRWHTGHLVPILMMVGVRLFFSHVFTPYLLTLHSMTTPGTIKICVHMYVSRIRVFRKAKCPAHTPHPPYTHIAVIP